MERANIDANSCPDEQPSSTAGQNGAVAAGSVAAAVTSISVESLPEATGPKETHSAAPLPAPTFDPTGRRRDVRFGMLECDEPGTASKEGAQQKATRRRMRGYIHVAVMTPLGNVLALHMRKTDTLSHLRSKIRRRTGLPNEQQRLVMNERNLDTVEEGIRRSLFAAPDERVLPAAAERRAMNRRGVTLEELGVRDGSQILLSPAMNSGPLRRADAEELRGSMVVSVHELNEDILDALASNTSAYPVSVLARVGGQLVQVQVTMMSDETRSMLSSPARDRKSEPAPVAVVETREATRRPPADHHVRSKVTEILAQMAVRRSRQEQDARITGKRSLACTESPEEALEGDAQCSRPADEGSPLATPIADGGGSTITASVASAHHRARCAVCNKKLGLASSFECRCTLQLCATHRYADMHGCTFDYKGAGRRALRDAMPEVIAPKMNRF